MAWPQTCRVTLISLGSQTQQNSLSNTQQGAEVLWLPPSFKDKTLNPETPGALNCGSELWSACLCCFSGIRLMDRCASTRFIFSLRMTRNQSVKATAALLHGKTTSCYSVLFSCCVSLWMQRQLVVNSWSTKEAFYWLWCFKVRLVRYIAYTVK